MSLPFNGLLLSLGILLALLLWMIANISRPLRRAVIGNGDSSLLDPAMIPEDYQRLREQVEPKLQALGFQFSHTQQRYSPFSHDPLPHYVWVYIDPSTCSHASLTASVLPGRTGSPYQVEFLSISADGRELSTVNGIAHQLLPLMDDYQLVDALAEDLAGQWQAHQHALAQWSGEPQRLAPAAFVQQEQRFLTRYRDTLRHQGWLVVDNHGNHRFPLGRALRFSWQIWRGEQRAGPLLAKAEDHDLAAPLAAEIDGFHRQQALSQGRSGTSASLGWFAFSMLLFAYSFGLRFSWDFVLMLIVVLLVHELGHLAGMWWFGYRELRILFIPFLGAVATGRDREVRPAQRLVVYLLGPMPGLLLGLVLLAGVNLSNGTWLLPWVIMLLMLNYLNLLPLLPLDGGQVVNTTLLGRLPRLQLLFAAISAGIAALAAWYLDSPALWLLVALLGLGAVAMNGRLALRRSLRERFPHAHEVSEDSLLRGIFQRLREPDYAPLPFARKVGLAQEMLRELGQEPPSLRVTVGGLTVYAACLLLPLVWLLAYPSASGLVNLTSSWGYESAPDFQAQLANSSDPLGRWRIHMDAGEWHQYGEEWFTALDHYQQAHALAATLFTDDDYRLNEARFALGQLSDDTEVAQTHLQHTLQQWQRVLPDDDPRLAAVAEELAWASDPQQAPTLLEIALAVRQRHQDDPLAEAATRSQLAFAHRQIGHDRAAQEQYLALAELVAAHPEEGQLSHYLHPALDYWLDQGDYLIAQDLLQRHLLPLTAQDVSGVDHRRALATLGWINFLTGDMDAAQARLEQAMAPTEDTDQGEYDWQALERVPVLLDLAAIHHALNHPQQVAHYRQRAEVLLGEVISMDLNHYLQQPMDTHTTAWQRDRRQYWRQTLAQPVTGGDDNE